MACLAEVAYRVDYSESSHILNTLYHLVPMASNGYVHYRIRTNPTVTWFWLLALSLMDLALISISTTISGGFSSNFFMLCFPAVTAFAMAPAPAVPQSLTSQRIQPGEGRPPQAHQAWLLPFSGRTARVRAQDAAAHRHDGGDIGSTGAGQSAPVDQPRPADQPPAEADRLAVGAMRSKVAAAGDPRLRPRLRGRAIAQRSAPTPTALHHPLPPTTTWSAPSWIPLPWSDGFR